MATQEIQRRRRAVKPKKRMRRRVPDNAINTATDTVEQTPPEINTVEDKKGEVVEGKGREAARTSERSEGGVSDVHVDKAIDDKGEPDWDSMPKKGFFGGRPGPGRAKGTAATRLKMAQDALGEGETDGADQLRSRFIAGILALTPTELKTIRECQ